MQSELVSTCENRHLCCGGGKS